MIDGSLRGHEMRRESDVRGNNRRGIRMRRFEF